ncbi:MnhB domain-containing protein [bacterium]|nr:MnhB domain-containing protein [bacterium]
MLKVLISTTIKYFSMILVVHSFYIFLRGHNEPGGGFIGGLILTLAAILYYMYSKRSVLLERLLSNFHLLISSLILIIIFVAIFPLLKGDDFLKGVWTSLKLPVAGKFSSILVFDTVIYLIVGLSVFVSFAAIQKKVLTKNKEIS